MDEEARYWSLLRVRTRRQTRRTGQVRRRKVHHEPPPEPEFCVFESGPWERQFDAPTGDRWPTEAEVERQWHGTSRHWDLDSYPEDFSEYLFPQAVVTADCEMVREYLEKYPHFATDTFLFGRYDATYQRSAPYQFTTALYYTCSTKDVREALLQVDMVRCLIEHGADVSYVNERVGMDCLHAALTMPTWPNAPEWYEIANALLRAGADPYRDRTVRGANCDHDAFCIRSRWLARYAAAMLLARGSRERLLAPVLAPELVAAQTRALGVAGLVRKICAFL